MLSKYFFRNTVSASGSRRTVFCVAASFRLNNCPQCKDNSEIKTRVLPAFYIEKKNKRLNL